MIKKHPNGTLVTTLLLAACCLTTLLSPWNAAQALANDPDGCVEQAATWADVHPTLLRAIAWVESRGNSRALNWNRDGSYDVGLMQINSTWYHRGLKPWWGSLGQPCVNVAAATWILKQCMETYGYTWNAVGCYHAGDGWTTNASRRPLGARYIQAIARVLRATRQKPQADSLGG